MFNKEVFFRVKLRLQTVYGLFFTFYLVPGAGSDTCCVGADKAFSLSCTIYLSNIVPGAGNANCWVGAARALSLSCTGFGFNFSISAIFSAGNS